MPIDVFRISVAAAPDETAALNRFLAAHKILSIDKQFVAAGENSFWSLLVHSAGGPASANPQEADKRTDYKDVLSPEDFAVFSQLRTARKDLAEKDGVPVYAVFTNDQLAEIAKLRVTSLAALSQIRGIGKAKVEKYGEKILEALTTTSPPHGTPNGEALPRQS